MFAKILRILNHFLFFKLNFYLLGMVFFRLSRKIKNNKNKYKNQTLFKITNACFGNMFMELDIHSYMGGSIYWSGYHHINESIYLNKILTSNMVFVDLGANQGEFTLIASKYIKNGKIISFEPVSTNFKRLKKNIELNQIKNVELNQFGLSDKNITLPIYTNPNISEGGINEGLSTLFIDGNKNQFEENVELKIFDELYFQTLERLDFIKIDIEGSELFALKGMEKSIEKFKPILLIEINNECFKSAGYDANDVSDFLNQFKYKTFKLFRGKLIKHEGEFSQWGNYVFKI
jgi:FkbM family methyltransferase